MARDTGKKKTAGKKKPAKKRPARKPATTPEPEQTLALTGDELNALNLHEARARMQATVLTNLTLRQEILNRDYKEQKAGLDAKQRATKLSLAEAQNNYNETVAAIEIRLGIKLADHRLEDDGTLVFQPVD